MADMGRRQPAADEPLHSLVVLGFRPSTLEVVSGVMN